MMITMMNKNILRGMMMKMTKKTLKNVMMMKMSRFYNLMKSIYLSMAVSLMNQIAVRKGNAKKKKKKKKQLMWM